MVIIFATDENGAKYFKFRTYNKDGFNLEPKCDEFTFQIMK